MILGSSKVYHEDAAKSSIIPPGHSAMISFIPNFNKDITKELDDAIRAALLNGEDVVSNKY